MINTMLQKVKITSFVLFSGTLLLLFAFSFCTKENTSYFFGKKCELVKTELGDCNRGKTSDSKSASEEKKDAVGFKIINDTLSVFVGLNYLCCTPFASDTKVTRDSILISLTDTCSGYSSCYCRCMCYYTWNFSFVDFLNKSYFYKVLLFKPKQVNPVIIKEGRVRL